MTLSSTTLRPLIAGNWKMNGLSSALEEARVVAADLHSQPSIARVAIFPPATLLSRLSDTLQGSPIATGAQDCHGKANGAHTGDISAPMIVDAGGSLVICGHSERRTDHGETSAQVAEKAEAAASAGLEPIVCVGETLEIREVGEAVTFVVNQLRESLPTALAGKAFSVAYEPLWAIGTGRTASVDNIVEMHAAIRKELVSIFGEQGKRIAILYGGSVKPENAGEILAAAEVGGALVGGASLKATDFLAIIRAV